MIKVGIIGATGYAGGELVRILTGHREAEIKWYGSRSYIDKKYADVYQNMFQIIDAVCLDDGITGRCDFYGYAAGIMCVSCKRRNFVKDKDYRFKRGFPSERRKNIRGMV